MRAHCMFHHIGTRQLFYEWEPEYTWFGSEYFIYTSEFPAAFARLLTPDTFLESNVARMLATTRV